MLDQRIYLRRISYTERWTLKPENRRAELSLLVSPLIVETVLRDIRSIVLLNPVINCN
jgi:hypothetical protein